jgi:SAM-dependent methyltransferase
LPRKHPISRIIPKLIYEVNRFFFRRFYSNFEFHPETRALETNPALGVGNGHALSRDLHVLIPFLVLLRFLGCKSILDLGSGDGFVLRLAEKFRYSEIIGIEANSALFELSEKNCTRGKLHNLFFEEINPDDFPNVIDLIYLFNPTDYVTVVKSCMKLKSKWFLMKNFALLDQDQLRLKVVKVLNYKSYSLYRSKVYNRV